ncbi:MAG TPA: DUF2971 domain-containing protein [Verrucomicrobiae bacterium]|nr:DUF2971 domain-containing protein [Verrucomicrobiae bacterium]
MAERIQIYRYLDSDAALKTLVSGAFKVGRISKFNDPFEWRFGAFNPRPDDHKKIERLLQLLHRQLEPRIGIICFSKVINDPVLWSLYADKHQGVAFELEHEWRDSDILHMAYSDNRPQVDLRRIEEIGRANTWDTEFEDYIRPTANIFWQQKSSNWSFEKESRLTVDLTNPKHCFESNGSHYWPIPKIFLKRIILAFQCPLEELHVEKLLKMNGFEAAKVVRARICSQTYTILC